jgi:S1-C subfamily serine protease
LITSIGCKSSPTQTVGTVIAKDLIVTVAHGVAGQTSTSIITVSGQVLNAKVVAIDINLDLALLYVDSTKSTTNLIPLKFANAVAGSETRFVAFEDSQQFAISAKIIKILRINTEDIYLKNKISRPGLEVETKVVVGNSGGPLINEKGEIIGIIWSTSRTVKNRSWATRIEAANELLSRVSTDNPSTQSPQVVACVG